MSSLLRDFLKKNNLTELPPPRVAEFFKDLPNFYYVAIAFALFATFIVIGLTFFQLFYVIRYVSHPTMQTDLYWIVFLCPIVSICNSVGICVPRTAAFLYSVGIVYFLLCVFVLVSLMTTLYGSRTKMCTKLDENGIKLNPRVFPYGCLFVCLPNIKPTPKNIQMLEWGVFQSPIIRVIIEIVSIAVYFEYETKQNWFFTPANLMSFISMCIASYSSYIVMPAAGKQLRQYRFLALFGLLDWAQFIYNVQKQVLEAIVLTGFFEDEKNLTYGPTTSIQFWASFLATQEMLIISCLATYFFQPTKSAFFDKYSSCDSSPSAGTALIPSSQNPYTHNSALEEESEVNIETEQFSSKISSKEMQSAEKELDQQSNGNTITKSGTMLNGEKPKSNEHYEQNKQQQQQKRESQQQQTSPNDGTAKNAATATTITTSLQAHNSIMANPNSTNNVKILQEERTYETADENV